MQSQRVRELTTIFRSSDAGQTGFRIYQSAVYGTLADNKLSTTLLLRDKKAKNKYVLSGSLSQVNNGLRFVLNPDSLLLNYQRLANSRRQFCSL